MINKINLIFVTFFGIGKIKFASGTLASLVTCVLLFIAFHVLSISSDLILLFLLIILIYSLIAVNACLNKFDTNDPKEIVIDEVIGQSIPLYLYEISYNIEKIFSKSLLPYLIIFVLFRAFDILKPFPINYFDRKYKNAFGIIFDDILAGFYVVVILILIMFVKSSF